MTTMAIRQIVEAFFRRWPIYAAILLACVGLGVAAVASSSDEYTSAGSVFVDSQSLVAAQSGVRETGGFSFMSPAQFTSQELKGLISTEIFMEAALERAGVDLSDDPAARRGQIQRMRASVGSSPNSENLVTVTVTTPNPELSFRVANGVIEEFVRFQIDVDVAESGASEQFFADLVESYEVDLTEARSAVESALSGVSDLEQLRPDRRLEVERLQQAEGLAEDRYSRALANLEASRLATLQTETDVRQSYSVFDPPVAAVEPNGGLIDDIFVVAGFTILGLGLALAAPMLSAALNRTVIFADEIDAEELGLSAVAVLPRVHKNETRLDGIQVPAGDSAVADNAEDLGQRTITFVPATAPGRRARGSEAETGDEIDQLLEEVAPASPAPAVQPPAPPVDAPQPDAPQPAPVVQATEAAAEAVDEVAAEAAPEPVVEPESEADDGTAESGDPSGLPDGAGEAEEAVDQDGDDQDGEGQDDEDEDDEVVELSEILPLDAEFDPEPQADDGAIAAPVDPQAPAAAKPPRVPPPPPPPTPTPLAPAEPARGPDPDLAADDTPNGDASNGYALPGEAPSGDGTNGGVSVVDVARADGSPANGSAAPGDGTNGVPDDDLPEAMKSLLETTEFTGYRPPDPPGPPPGGQGGPPPPPHRAPDDREATPAPAPKHRRGRRRG